MSDLKPCPFCGKAPRVEGILEDVAVCRTDGCWMRGVGLPVDNWNTRPVPELPGGYEIEDAGLYFGKRPKRELVATLIEGTVAVHVPYVDAQALAAFIQGAR